MNKFIKAKPVWLKGKEKEMNVSMGIQCNFIVTKNKAYKLLITGSSLYRIFINGQFIHYGPARGPHGYVRIDCLNLEVHLKDGLNTLSIEAAGYNCNTFYVLNIPSFVQAEIIEDDDVITYTDTIGAFSAIQLTSRVQKTMRYSFQRAFTEIYNFDNNDFITNWMNTKQRFEEDLSIIDFCIKYLPRDLPLPLFENREAKSIIGYGRGEKKSRVEKSSYKETRFINKISEEITGYTLEQIIERPYEVIQDIDFIAHEYDQKLNCKNFHEEIINQGEYVILDMGINNNGFIYSEIFANVNSEIYFVFDEKLIDGKIDIDSWKTINIVQFNLAESNRPYHLETFETYGFKYIMCYVAKGSIELSRLGLREYSYPDYKNISFKCSDKDINRIFSAAVETYRQNTLDVFMDCPTRERAGWLCDSYFTAQSAQYFSGDARVEKVFLENFIMAERFPNIPNGMLPMCYPAEFADGDFIPQWAMWYIIELDGYFKRDAHADKGIYKNLCYSLINYFKKFKNKEGLLERLERWNFIEWSEANDWVQDVNYPTNMLYSRILTLIGKWYDDDDLLKESNKVKNEVISQSFNGEFFIDNSIRTKTGILEVTKNKSEVCQYFAFFFEIADEKEGRFKNLKKTILESFGPDRKKQNVMPEVAYANAFIGNYLRMELLLRWKKYKQILYEIKAYFMRMAEITGTLWEHDDIKGSLNHGFASFVGVAIIKCLTGIFEINEAEREMAIDIVNVGIDVEVCLGTSLGDVYFKREAVNGKSKITISVPQEFKLKAMESCKKITKKEGEI
jgi:alpha-L-rhamnosidase